LASTTDFWLQAGVDISAAFLLSGYKFLIDNVRRACEVGCAEAVKLLIVAYCYVDCPG